MLKKEKLKDKESIPAPIPTNPLVDPVMQSAVAHVYKKHVTFYPEGHKQAGKVSSRNHWAHMSQDLQLSVGASIHPDYLRNNRVCVDCW